MGTVVLNVMQIFIVADPFVLINSGGFLTGINIFVGVVKLDWYYGQDQQIWDLHLGVFHYLP